MDKWEDTTTELYSMVLPYASLDGYPYLDRDMSLNPIRLSITIMIPRVMATTWWPRRSMTCSPCASADDKINL
jgi:hypothetical protein